MEFIREGIKGSNPEAFETIALSTIEMAGAERQRGSRDLELIKEKERIYRLLMQRGLPQMLQPQYGKQEEKDLLQDGQNPLLIEDSLDLWRSFKGSLDKTKGKEGEPRVTKVEFLIF